MSVFTKKVTGQDYVYFQYYRDGKKVEEYIGRKDDPAIVQKLLAKFSEHQEYDLEKFCSRIKNVTGFEVTEEDRRRLQETITENDGLFIRPLAILGAMSQELGSGLKATLKALWELPGHQGNIKDVARKIRRPDLFVRFYLNVLEEHGYVRKERRKYRVTKPIEGINEP